MVYRIAVIGLGKIAQDQHLPCIGKNADFQLVAVASQHGRHEQVPSFRTAEEMFASGLAIDAVSLCVPPEPRFAVARTCFAAKVHVLIEKPPTPTIGEMFAMKADAERAGCILFTTWHSQYNAAVDEAKRLLAGQRVTRLFVNWKEDVRHWHPNQEWIWQAGGFGVLDPGINAFSIVTKIMPAPIFIDTCRLETPRNRDTPIAAQIRFKPSWSGDADLSAELDWRQTGEQSWNIDVETASGLKLQLRKGGTELYVDGQLKLAAPMAEYEAIYDHFAALLASGQSYVDTAPLELMGDCFMKGRRADTEAFVW